MIKKLVIFSIIFTTIIYSQIDTLQVYTDSTTFSIESDSVSIYEEYYNKGYQAGIDDYSPISNSKNIPEKYILGLDDFQSLAFKNGYEEANKINQTKNKKVYRGCIKIGCVSYGIAVASLFILTALIANTT